MPMPEHLQIPPLLLLPLIENAFKHGVDAALTESRVNLKLKAGDGRINFSVENTVPTVPVHIPGGIGLANVRKRLQHYYPGRHQLTIENPPGLFRVHLMITL
jgi:sensor histidine kinase YesM